MQCPKCGSEWKDIPGQPIQKCPFCGEQVTKDIPYRQSVDALCMIVDRFGIETYTNERKLHGLVNDLIPNAVKEKNIVRNAITFGLPQLIFEAVNSPGNEAEILRKAYEVTEHNGLNSEWCAAMLFVFGFPANIDTRNQYPVKTKSIGLRKWMTGSKIAATSKHMEESYDEKAITELQNLSEQGDVEATLELGERYYYGKDVAQNYVEALRCYRRADAYGDPIAQYNIGEMYDHAQGVTYDAKKAFEYYKKSADQGFTMAEISLGEMYYLGQGCTKNDQEALYWLLKAEKDGADSRLYIVIATVLRDSEDPSVNNPTKAFEYMQKAVNTESATAYNLMGTFYEMGCGVKQDYDKALEYYQRAADLGMESAYLNVGAYYQNGVCVKKDEVKAAECFQLGADAGNMDCLNALGMCYKKGTGVPQSYEKAFDLFLKSAYAGNFAGEYNVGLCYSEGQGVDIDKAEAKKWFMLSADKGYSKALAFLGLFAEQGIPDGKPNNEEALNWYLKSANIGDYGGSQFIIGNCRTQGLLGSYIDRLEGFEWYLKAAHNGHPTAQNNVGCEYLNGVIVDQDYDEAVKWFEAAIAQNDPYALDNYGIMLINGNGIQRDVSRGFAMLKNSAEQDCLDAKLNLGICYFEGWGTQRDLDKALKWLTESYANSSEVAEKYLQKGYKCKNGQWVKKGIWGKVPAAQNLPPVHPIVGAKKGCLDDCDFYTKDEHCGKRCHCKKLHMEVFMKKKCPYYHSVLDDFASWIANGN